MLSKTLISKSIYNVSVPTTNNPIDVAIEKFRDYPSSRSTKENKISGIFDFPETETNIIKKEINRLGLLITFLPSF